ncbi:hypothetical protein FA95DRAFT_1558081 [Auriscalpium vulgare]|uniref:Uncharacterized protein n=1 Tax=Auriscalpium vulgare TaxID=40419 RepID=A0ACB8RX69_9AGAM|nr:hypothetical protein FA95DRAFT_1558081 [Auriscalpium vulgare]
MGNTRSRPYVYSPVDNLLSWTETLKDDWSTKQSIILMPKDVPPFRDGSPTIAHTPTKASISRAESRERKRHQMCVARDDAALLALANKHPDLSAVDPAVLAQALFHAIGIHTDRRTEWRPPADFVIYLELTEDRARHSPERTLPAESLAAAAYHFLARRAAEKTIETHWRVPGFGTNRPADLVSSSISDRDRLGNYRRLYELVDIYPSLHNADATKLASALYRALDLPRGQQPSPEFVIFFEFIDGQRYNLGYVYKRTRPAKSLASAAYYFLMNLATKRDEKRWKRRYPDDKLMQQPLLRALDEYPDLSLAPTKFLAQALYIAIGLNTAARPAIAQVREAINAEFRDDQRNHNPNRALEATSLVEATYNYLHRRILGTWYTEVLPEF